MADVDIRKIRSGEMCGNESDSLSIKIAMGTINFA